ncbi:NnrU family protein [Undibacterium arcticum]|uniref:NnrU family protein n=1 Tax=Undibacterium arcticum TaxID=1762892 RepID=A0ABV7F760_9BURK
MTILILGLLLFLGVHSVRMVADGWRARQITRLGGNLWKGAYSLLSVLGLGLIIWGYGLSRAQPVVLWEPDLGMRHLTALLTMLAFILLAATYVPGSRLKAAVGHPMMLGVSIWALAHLLSNGSLTDVLLFGAFLIWSVLGFRAARRRDRAAGVVYRAGTLAGDAKVVVVGLLAWGLFAEFLHGWLIGVKPFG